MWCEIIQINVKYQGVLQVKSPIGSAEKDVWESLGEKDLNISVSVNCPFKSQLKIKSNQIKSLFIVTSPQHKCLGEWNSYKRAPDSAKKTTIYIWTVHIYRLYRRQCAKYTSIYSVHIVYYKDILSYQLHIIHRMGTSTLKIPAGLSVLCSKRTRILKHKKILLSFAAHLHF